MAVVKLISYLFIALLVTSCGVNQKLVLKAGQGATPPVVTPEPGPGKTLTFITGKFLDASGKEHDFKDFQDKPTVLIFASEFCGICIEETEHILKRLDGKLPSNVHVVTLLVGLKKPAWANDWVNDHGVTWLVGIDPKLDLKNKYCGPSPVPCNVVQTPEKGIVLQKIGAASVADLESLTGTWETK